MIRRIVIPLLLLASGAAAETLTAARVVRPNAIITSGDVAVGAVGVPGALAADADIIGMEAKTTLYPGRPIMPAHVGPAALVERNQPITLIFRQGGLTIFADARALSRGAVGDVVRVMNLSSRTTVSGRVLPNGRVEVSPAEAKK